MHVARVYLRASNSQIGYEQLRTLVCDAWSCNTSIITLPRLQPAMYLRCRTPGTVLQLLRSITSRWMLLHGHEYMSLIMQQCNHCICPLGFWKSIQDTNWTIIGPVEDHKRRLTEDSG
jgi:hypothetical protein